MSHKVVVMPLFNILFVCLLATACNTINLQPAILPEAPKEVAAINAVLDDFHDAAAKADGDRYFGAFAPEGVFMGTDPTERWTLEAFRAWAAPYFEEESAWIFTPHDRNVFVAGGGTVAWFDEVASSESYGDCRGTGALRKIAGQWKITHYNLSIPLPNEITKEVVSCIRSGDSVTTKIIIVRHAEKVNEPGNPDPALTREGRQRAFTLAQVLGDIRLDAVYATQFKRTQETVALCATNNGLEPFIVQAGRCAETAKRMMTENEGQTVLFSGHSNTVPGLLTALGVDHNIVIRDQEYSNLFIVTLKPGTAPGLLHLHYGVIQAK